MDEEKTNAAAEAAKLVKKGMNLGLGTGSTAAKFIEAVAGREKKEGLGLRCVATSMRSEEFASRLGLKILSLEELDSIDLAVDGADQIDPGLRLIKGLGGGAITREKVVDYAAEKFVVIADEGKLVKKLRGNIPVECIRFASGLASRELMKLGAGKIDYRTDARGGRFLTDNGNYLLDCFFPEVKNPKKLEGEINAITGVLENGIFTKKVHSAIIGLKKGVKILR